MEVNAAGDVRTSEQAMATSMPGGQRKSLVRNKNRMKMEVDAAGVISRSEPEGATAITMDGSSLEERLDNENKPKNAGVASAAGAQAQKGPSAKAPKGSSAKAPRSKRGKALVEKRSSDEGEEDEQKPKDKEIDQSLAGLDAEHAEKLTEKEALLKFEHLAKTLRARGIGDKTKEGHLINEIIDDKKGPEVLDEILNISGAMNEPEGVDEMVKADLAPTAADLVALERFELGDPNITDPEEEGEEMEKAAERRLSDRSLIGVQAGKLWPEQNGVVTINWCRGPGLTHKAANMMKLAAWRIWFMCNKFKFKEVADGHQCQLRVKGNSNGCWSWVGYGGSRTNEINLRDGNKFQGTCAVLGIAEHEILHTLGMSHEQSRPDRNHNIRVYDNNIKSDKIGNFGVKASESTAEPYDIKSLMHYGCKGFVKHWWQDSIRASRRRRFWDGRAGRRDCSEMGQRMGMSTNDVKQLQSMYKCELAFKWFR